MLKRVNRLTKNGSFNFVYRKGAAQTFDSLKLTSVAGGRTVKVGFSVPNKVGRAVVRNKLKRRLRAIVREFIPRIKYAQIVISAKASASELNYEQLKNAVETLLTRAQLLSEVK